MNVLAKCLIIFLFVLFHPLELSLADSKCHTSFNCGNLGPLEFPLSSNTQPECGYLQVDCEALTPRVQMAPGEPWYDVLQRISTNKFSVRDPGLGDQLVAKSCSSFQNRSLPYSPFCSITISPVLTMFACTEFVNTNEMLDYFKDYKNYTSCEPSTLYYKDRADDGFPVNMPKSCSVVKMPVKPNSQDSGDLFQRLTADFELEWNISDECHSCHNRGSMCVLNSHSEFHCQVKSEVRKVLLIGGAALTGITSVSIMLFLFIWRKGRLLKMLKFRKATVPDIEKDIELLLKKHGNLAPTRYRYSDLKKMANSFTEDLGRGGYGTVYKGKLPEGRLVAVKILNESKGNGEEFINEVASISRTSHINIVSLLGFCYEGSSKRALIYDFMPNGSLEKFIRLNTAECQLGWEKLFEIAVGVARGLEYLHRLCNMRIVHFDIKPHNILLDQDLNPKISDFGLAKLCPNRSSVLSMLVARGTIGYIAPEVFCRNFGVVSHKSDVYSYGMMVLEIARGTKNNDLGNFGCSSEIYFPQYIYKQLETMNAANLDGIVEEDEGQLTKRKLIIVGLWCIQTDPKDRPTMSKVTEMLEGKLETLQVPPKPYLSSPPRSPPGFSISESM